MNIKRFAILLWFFFKHIHEFIELYFWSLSIIYCKVSLVNWKILYLFINNPKRVMCEYDQRRIMIYVLCGHQNHNILPRISLWCNNIFQGEKRFVSNLFPLKCESNARIETQNSIHFYNHNTVTGCFYYLEVVWWIFARMRYNESSVMRTTQH